MNVLKQHWEKILLAVVAIVALLVIALSLVSSVETDTFSKGKNAEKILDNSALDSYKESIKLAGIKVPEKLASNPFLHNELQYCTKCKKLQPKWSRVCPECGTTVSYKKDADGDGIPNKWEQKYGLNWTSPDDANLDSDGDGISNLEEYKRDSDPTNPLDPNIILDEYTVLKVYRPTRPIMMVKCSKASIQLKYKGRTKFANEGKEIKDNKGKPIYKVGTATFKKVGVWNKMINSTQNVDKSEVTVTDLASGDVFTLVVGETNYYDYVEAQIQPKAGGEIEIIKKGAVLDLKKYKEKAKLESLDENSRECVFDVKGRKYKVKANK